MTRGKSPAALAAGVVNRTLAGEHWAREKLAAHAGKIFALESGPLSASYAIGDDGSLAVAAAGAAPSVTLAVSPLALPVLAADPLRWPSLVSGEGDPKLAAAIEELASTFPWFVERAFAAALGPVVGQKVAGREAPVDPGRDLARRCGEPRRLRGGIRPRRVAGRARDARQGDRRRRGAPGGARRPRREARIRH